MTTLINHIRNRRKRKNYLNLNMGMVKQYSMIVSKGELEYWKRSDWIEAPGFRNYHYAPSQEETVVLARPSTISREGTNMLIGSKLIGYCAWLGTYGMGGPGFFGLLLDGIRGISYRAYLVFCVWGADEYILFDDRVVSTAPQYHQQYKPWISLYGDPEIGSWDDLSPAIANSRIENIQLYDDRLIIGVQSDRKERLMRFLKNHEELPPHGSGITRKDAFSKGVIGDYLMIQHEHAVLHV